MAAGRCAKAFVEEVNSHLCIVCPWHTYKVTLATGEKLYRATEMRPDGKLVPVGRRSAGVRQRCHLAYEEGGSVYVQLGTEPAELPSDKYACDKYACRRVQTGSVNSGLQRWQRYSFIFILILRILNIPKPLEQRSSRQSMILMPDDADCDWEDDCADARRCT